MANFYLAPTSNLWSTTLNGNINDAVTTITLSSTTGLQAPGVLIIDREDGNGTATPPAREFISFTGISGSDITGVTRAFDNSTARSHSTGALVEAVPAVGLWNDMSTALRASLTTSGAGIALSGTASIANMRLTNSINASGASIIGIFPSGASGSVMVSRANNTPPVFASVPRIKVGTFTYDTATASGSQAITGIGFKPMAVMFIANIAASISVSVGIDDGTSAELIGQSAGGTWTNDTTSLLLLVSGGNQAKGAISTLDADGFTISWTKTGTPTGTAQIGYLAIG